MITISHFNDFVLVRLENRSPFTTHSFTEFIRCQAWFYLLSLFLSHWILATFYRITLSRQHTDCLHSQSCCNSILLFFSGIFFRKFIFTFLEAFLHLMSFFLSFFEVLNIRNELWGYYIFDIITTLFWGYKKFKKC